MGQLQLHLLGSAQQSEDTNHVVGHRALQQAYQMNYSSLSSTPPWKRSCNPHKQDSTVQAHSSVMDLTGPSVRRSQRSVYWGPGNVMNDNT